ncbi:hypothetical protein NECAME_01985 [Necator americanus]|uniref:Uncharacterized protein n=1 Tax=Necator americanus TaxID=51031 RepID=W2TKE8_NECAM|nr:hypothetical protein NECAME_01985 [Necator americanus]ETN82248.1 hypothetical protein NECAME_01985 [Necator americanus]
MARAFLDATDVRRRNNSYDALVNICFEFDRCFKLNTLRRMRNEFAMDCVVVGCCLRRADAGARPQKQTTGPFINARRRIVQPMIDQSNRAGRAPAVSVFKNRRRNRSDQSPGPSPDLGAGYSPDTAAVTMPVAYPGAEIYNMQRTMFPTTPYSAFPNPAMANPFMPQMGMMGFPSAGAAPWMDPSLLSSTHGMEG